MRIGMLFKVDVELLFDWRREGLCDFEGSGTACLAAYGRIVCSGSSSTGWRELLEVSSKLSKLSSDRRTDPSSEAKAFSLSDESLPPKLSCGRRWGRCSALGDIAVAKSSSQLSSSSDSAVRKRSAVDFVVGEGNVSTKEVFRLEGRGAALWSNLCGFLEAPAPGDRRASFHS